MADPYRQIMALLDQIDETVCQAELHRHVRMVLNEARQQGSDMQPAEDQGCGDRQPAPRLRSFAWGGKFRLVKVGEDPAGPLEIAAPRVGEADRACGAVKQPGTET